MALPHKKTRRSGFIIRCEKRYCDYSPKRTAPGSEKATLELFLNNSGMAQFTATKDFNPSGCRSEYEQK
jgi:hypothetical protein